VKLVDQKRMRGRAWRSGTSAVILAGFLFADSISFMLFPTMSNFLWVLLIGVSLIVEGTSTFFWSRCDLRAPLLSGINQFWIGILAGGNSIWSAYHPEVMSRMGIPPEELKAVIPLYRDLNLCGGVIIFLLQALIAYQFWSGGPRGYRPLLYLSRNPAPASE
jgi:uncharacterized membrane protein HdeD (DUF308 family)